MPRYDEMTEWGQHFMTSLPKDAFDEVIDTGPEFNVKVQVNGIEVGFLGFLETLERSFDYYVNEAAREQIETKFTPLDDELEQVAQIVRRAKEKLALKAGVVLDDDSWN